MASFQNSPRFSTSISASSSLSSSRSSSFLPLHHKNAGLRSFPRRGQVKAAIFASLFASIATVLGLRAKEDGASQENTAEFRPDLHAFEVDVDGRLSAEYEGATMELSLPHRSPHSRFIQGSTVQV